MAALRSTDPTPESNAERPAISAGCSIREDIPQFDVAIAAPDISPWLAGNASIPGFVTRDSGKAGPHVLLVSLTHGNEFAGAIVLDRMLRAGTAPAIGKLTLGFANIAAFQRFDAGNPVASRFVDEDLNRVWDDIQLFGVRRSLELDRAREIRPLIDTADIVLDLHSMLWPSDPLLLCGATPQGRDLAMALGTPGMVVADQGHAGGKRLIDYARFAEPACSAACILVEAGQHWQADTITQMQATIDALLSHTGLAPPLPARAKPSFAKVSHVITAKTNRFTFTQPYRGGDIIQKTGSLIAHDGDAEIRTPYGNCVLIMPSHQPSHGHTAVRLAKLKN